MISPTTSPCAGCTQVPEGSQACEDLELTEEEMAGDEAMTLDEILEDGEVP